MKYILSSLKFLIFFISLYGYALDSTTIEEQANSSIKELYTKVRSQPNLSMASRITWFSSQFIGVPYLLGSLGEGPSARYDQYPRYRIDGFDCDTYVTTVLALALGTSLESFQRCLKYTRYKDGKVTYIHRNHFMSLDWNPNNQLRGVLKDITLTIKDQNNKPVAEYAEAMINKPNWYAYKTLATIRLQNDNKEEQAKRLSELKNKARALPITPAKIPYLPFSALFLKNNEPIFIYLRKFRMVLLLRLLDPIGIYATR